jgi:hypothetical protein
MRILSFTFSLALMAFSHMASAQVMPAPSPLAKVYQKAGFTEIELEYSRPALKGRDLFRSFVPQGELWRTGANAATTISFSETVFIGGAEVPAGKYAIFTIPGATDIEVIFNSDYEQSGTSKYDKTKNVATAKARLSRVTESVERMRFTLENMTDKLVDLSFAWGVYRFDLGIKLNTDAAVRDVITKKIEEYERPYGFYNEIARYYVDNEMGASQAVEWAKYSVRYKETFWNVHTLARAYHLAGDKDMAMKTAQRSLELSKEADYPPYQRMNEELIRQIKEGMDSPGRRR